MVPFDGHLGDDLPGRRRETRQLESAVIDWPSREVPDALARAGYRVISHDGPGVEDYNSYELDDGEVVIRNLGSEPYQADLVYTHRPFDELPAILELAQRIGATAIWSEAGPDTPGADRACRVVESARPRTSMLPASPTPSASIAEPEDPHRIRG